MFAIGRMIGAVLAAVMLGSTALAQDTDLKTGPETRLGGEGFESPPAALADMNWLVGQWHGEGIQGAPAMESWLPPSGGTMVGTFVQETAEGQIMFTEHLYLMEEEGSLVLRLKHFNADLTGWEEKDDMLTFRLIAMEPCAAYFNALTLRCADPARPGEGLVAAVRMKSDKPEPQELLFRFDRMGAGHDAVSYASSCADAYTTLAMNDCLAGILTQSDERRASYVAKALERHADRPALAQMIAASDSAFVAYRDSECGAVYEDWKEGSIRGVMSLTCRIDMTDKRILTVWENWLTYPDSTPALMPEPEPTR